MEHLTGRKHEISILSKLIKSRKAELLAVYGRRRVGKTFLVSRFFCDKGIYFEMTGIKNGSKHQQIKAFLRRIETTFGPLQLKHQPRDWFSAFEVLEDTIRSIQSKQKIILFFDEFPWMDTHKSDLLQSFEFFWNSCLSKDPRIITVICGSSVSWMVRKIIHNKAGLYGRLTAQIRLKPFTLSEVEEYFQTNHIHLDRKQIVEVTMALGGIPKYLSYVEPGHSSMQIIQRLCFTPSAPLTTEYQVLYESLFDDYQQHMQIIEILAKSKSGLTLSQISEKAKRAKGGSLSRALKELIASNFVQCIPFYARKSREGKYRVIDEYSYFYLNWIKEALHNYDEAISPHYWIKQQSSAKYKSWAGYMFESICFKHVGQIIKHLELTVVADSASYWQFQPQREENTPGAQIDLVIDRSDQCMNLCEIKFYNTEYEVSKAAAHQYNLRRETFRKVTGTRKTLFNTLITPYAANVNQNYHSAIDNQLTLDALFDQNAYLIPATEPNLR